MTFETVKLSEVADIIVGFAFKSQDFNTDGNGVRLVRGKNITKRSLRWGEDTRWWSDFSIDLSRYFLKENDIVIGMDGSLVGKNYAKITESDLPLLLVQRVACIRAKKGISQEYLWQIIATPVFEKYIDAVKTGTTIPHISGKQIGEYEIPYVDYETQLKISGILSSIEERVLLNTAINENLESQAQAFFINLFITNAKPEWKTGSVSDLGNVVGGGTPSKKVEEYYTNDGIAWITPKDLSNNKSKFIAHGETDITDLGLAKSSATLMPKGTVLFSSRAPIGYIAIADGQVSTNQGFKSIVPFDNVGTAYVYYFLKENLSAIENVASGSTFKEVSGSTMKNFPTVIPDDDTLAEFKQFCSPLLEQQQALEYENRYLASLRDTLLPKLMNGEIDVSAVKI